MEHIACKKCESEYDLAPVDVSNWHLPPHDTTCQLCGSVLKGWDNHHENILIMAKRGMVASPA